MKVLKGLWNGLISAEKLVMVTANLAIAVLVFITVVLRYILHKNLPGVEEVILFIAMWIYFMGASYGSYEESQITADILSVFIKNEKSMRILALIRAFFSSIVLLIADYCAFEMLAYAITAKSCTTILRIPMAIIYIPVVAGIVLMSIYAIYHTVEHGIDVRKMLSGKKEA